MLKPKKKITKKELKEDKLVTTYFKATNYLYEKKKLLFGAIGGLVAIVLIGLIIYSNRKAANEEANTAFANILAAYDQGVFQVAIDGVPNRNLKGFKQIVEEYGSTPVGELAKFYLANSYFALKDYDSALKYFEEYGGSNDLVAASCLAGVAAVYETKSQYKDAAEYFEKAGNKMKDALTTPEHYCNAARNYALAGDKSKALELYEKVKKDYPTSNPARDVDRFIVGLKAS
jgi:tetratricopeptide (TPR) repeat protein